MPSGEYSKPVSYFHWTKVGPSANIQNASVALAYLLLELQTVHSIFCFLKVPDYIIIWTHLVTNNFFWTPDHRTPVHLFTFCALMCASGLSYFPATLSLHYCCIAEQEQKSPCCILIFLCLVFLFYPPSIFSFLSLLHQDMLTSPQIHSKEFNYCDSISAWVINCPLWSSHIPSCSATFAGVLELPSIHPSFLIFFNVFFYLSSLCCFFSLFVMKGRRLTHSLSTPHILPSVSPA